VPESELPTWVEEKADEVVETALTPLTRHQRKLRKQRQVAIPELATKVDDSWVKALISVANERLADEIRSRRELEDEDETILLLAA